MTFDLRAAIREAAEKAEADVDGPSRTLKLNQNTSRALRGRRAKLQETGELCPTCQRRDVLAVFEQAGETFIACEICDYDERS